MIIDFGIARTRYGHEICVLQEDGTPLMSIGSEAHQTVAAAQEELDRMGRMQEWLEHGRRWQ